MFRYVHAPDAETDKPFVILIDSDQYRINVSGLGPAHYKCLLCEKAGGVSVTHIREDQVVTHISEV